MNSGTTSAQATAEIARTQMDDEGRDALGLGDSNRADVGGGTTDIDVAEASIAVEQVAERGSCAVAPEARLAEIRQMFEGKAMSYFVMAQRAREYHDIFAKRDIAQSAQNPRVGRPGVVSAMARELAVPGNSPAAKRAWLDRALKVARMSPQAVEAAKNAKLNRNRSALIEIAEEDSPGEQLQKVEQIVRRKEKKKKEAKTFITRTAYLPVAGGKELLAKLIAFADEFGIRVE